jgi:hypothetical protein
MVLIGYVAAVVLGIPYLQHRRGDALYVAYLLVLTALLGLICWWKGERPQWRGNRPTDREGPGT